jgi:hypothetical protein
MDLSAPTSPSDCALAIAVPLDREEFLAALGPESSRDFPRWYAGQRGGAALLDVAVWKLFWEREGERILALARDVESLGVRVVFQCRLADVAELARQKTVVTLLAHWHSGALQQEHVTDPAQFLHRLRHEEHPVVRQLYAALPADAREIVDGVAAGRAVGVPEFLRLLESVNTILQTHDLRRSISPSRAVWRSPAAHALEANRDALCAALPGLLVGATGVDLYDGAYRADDVAEAFPNGYSGLLELAVCRSMFVAERIKHRHPGCNVIGNDGLTTILFRALLYTGTIREISRRPAPYASTEQGIRVKLWDSLSRS